MTASGSTLPRPVVMASRRWPQRLIEPVVLFPMVGLMILAGLWGMTLNLIALERAGAREQGREAALEVADTFEAQMVRALREIEQTLALVAYMHDRGYQDAALEELRARDLLPPEMLFVVSVTDPRGTVQASSRARMLGMTFAGIAAPGGDALSVGPSRFDAGTGQWWLDFIRPLDATDAHPGFAAVSVDASYFVSGYDPARLGRRGMLGLLGDDGIYRARRSGDDVVYGGRANVAGFAGAIEVGGDAVALLAHAWDGEHRFTTARQVYGFPLTVVTGLSVAEQSMPARADIRTYLLRAAAGSLFVIVLLIVLGRQSWLLQRSRQQAMKEQLEHARRVEHLAFHDGLTGLPNRSYFNRLLQRSIAEASRYQRSLALMFIDLDGFKAVNDALGHDIGDDLLVEIARRLRRELRESDVVARIGGDEFVILLPEFGDDLQLSRVARRIIDAAGEPCHIEGHELHPAMSVGISVYPRDGLTEEALLKCADVAMYHAKASGKHTFRHYAPHLNGASVVH